MFIDWFLLIVLFIFGAILGSYLNSWMWRVHEGKWRWGGRSMCVHCGRQLAWHDNIPLLSFLHLRGKCATCKHQIPVDYFWVELAVALLFVGIGYYHLQLPWNAVAMFRDLFVVAVLTVVFVYDLKYMLVLPNVVWGASVIVFVINYYLGVSPYSLFLGAAVGGGLFLLQYTLSRGRWVGGGDVRLGVFMGVALGWPNILVGLFAAYMLGMLVAIPLLLSKKKGMKSEVPFGTFLAVGTMVAMLWGGTIVGWYWGMIGF